MTRCNAKVVKEYLNLITQNMRCSRLVSLTFRKAFEEEIKEYAEGSESITIEALYEKFGTPEQIAEGFTSRDDYEELLKAAQKKKRIFAVCFVVAAVMCAFLIGLFILFVIKSGGKIYVSDAEITTRSILEEAARFQ